MKKLELGAIVCVIATLVICILSIPTRFRLNAISPSGNVEVRGLPFKGKDSHPLDGTLRLYIGDFKQQTTLDWSDRLSISWETSDSSETFSISRDGDILMRWNMKDGLPLCITGENYLTDDPYK